MKSNARQREIRKRLRELVPLAPMSDFATMEQTATAGHLRHLPPSIAAWQAATTQARHAHTEYDSLLAEGYDQESARHFVQEAINLALQRWGCARRISDKDDQLI